MNCSIPLATTRSIYPLTCRIYIIMSSLVPLETSQLIQVSNHQHFIHSMSTTLSPFTLSPWWRYNIELVIVFHFFTVMNYLRATIQVPSLIFMHSGNGKVKTETGSTPIYKYSPFTLIFFKV